MLMAPVAIYAVGWTPTDAGLVLNFEPGDQFLLSVWIDLDSDGVEDQGEEFFVCVTTLIISLQHHIITRTMVIS